MHFERKIFQSSAVRRRERSSDCVIKISAANESISIGDPAGFSISRRALGKIKGEGSWGSSTGAHLMKRNFASITT